MLKALDLFELFVHIIHVLDGILQINWNKIHIHIYIWRVSHEVLKMLKYQFHTLDMAFLAAFLLTGILNACNLIFSFSSLVWMQFSNIDRT